MARPRSFDPETALGAALEVFWTKGFEATSISDLVEAMGIQRGSLYQTFGDKKALFLRALEGYLAQGLAHSDELLASAESPLAGIGQWFQDAMTKCPSRLGCFGVNVTAELSGQDKNVAAITDGHWKALERVLVRTLSRGQEQGEIRNDLSPEELSRLLLNSLAGAQALGKQRSRRSQQAMAFSETLISLLAAPE